MKLSFKDWLYKTENATTTADVAGFQRRTFDEPIRRQMLAPWGEEDPFFRRKKKDKEKDD